MGAIPYPRRSGVLPALVLAAAVAAAYPASAQPWPLHSPFPADGEIGATMPDQESPDRLMAAAFAKLPPTIGRSSLDAEVLCLARNIYWEAKSEPRLGKIAVAAVTLNRLEDRRFPGTICGVVTQRVGRSCQFRWACDRRREVTPSGPLWQESVAVAREALSLGHDDPTGGALFFHGVRERTDWRGMRKVAARIHNHVFYR
jgi:N-acetylmuramoyl-L-alanine amidase